MLVFEKRKLLEVVMVLKFLLNCCDIVILVKDYVKFGDILNVIEKVGGN